MKIFLIILIIIVFTAILSNYRVFKVISGSMEPAIKNGSLVIVKKSHSYKIGDLITFKYKGTETTITHRVVRIILSQQKYVISTKGDSNSDEDLNTITPSDIIGKVVLTLPFSGKILSTATDKKYLPFLFYIPSGLLFGTLIRKLVVSI